MPGVNGVAAAGPDWNGLRTQLKDFVLKAIDSDRSEKKETITARVQLDGHEYEISHTPEAALSPLGRAFRKVCSDLFGVCPRSRTRRADLPESIGGRIVNAVLDVFRHRLPDAYDGPGVELLTPLPPRARLIDAVFEDMYRQKARFLTRNVYQDGAPDYHCRT